MLEIFSLTSYIIIFAGWEFERGAITPEVFRSTGKNVAIVGSDPASLSVATELVKMGHHSVIFEALHETGGVLTYGIPEFRLPKKVVKQEVDYIKKLVKIRPNIIIGKTITVEELFEEGFDGVFLGTGVELPNLLGNSWRKPLRCLFTKRVSYQS